MKTKEEVAYYLGTKIVDGFYGTARWVPETDGDFPHEEYYNWTDGYGAILNYKKSDEKIVKSLDGWLKEDCFETAQEKIEYVKGAISRCGKIDGDKLKFSFANGKRLAERVIKLIGDAGHQIARNNSKTKVGVLGILDANICDEFSIKNYELEEIFGYPIGTSLSITLHENFIKLFK